LTLERIIIVAVIMAAVAGIAWLRVGIQKAQARASGTAMRTGLRAAKSQTLQMQTETTQAESLSPGAFSFAAPVLLHRSDFPQPEMPCLLAVFTAKNCQTCSEVWQQQQQFKSASTAVVEVRQKKLLRRYGIEAVPVVALADSVGKVRWCHLGRLPNSAQGEIKALLADLSG